MFRNIICLCVVFREVRLSVIGRCGRARSRLYLLISRLLLCTASETCAQRHSCFVLPDTTCSPIHNANKAFYSMHFLIQSLSCFRTGASQCRQDRRVVQVPQLSSRKISCATKRSRGLNQAAYRNQSSGCETRRDSELSVQPENQALPKLPSHADNERLELVQGATAKFKVGTSLSMALTMESSVRSHVQRRNTRGGNARCSAELVWGSWLNWARLHCNFTAATAWQSSRANLNLGVSILVIFSTLHRDVVVMLLMHTQKTITFHGLANANVGDIDLDAILVRQGLRCLAGP